jgi:signal transduction histidine kinase
VAEDLEFLAALARLATPVLENARLVEESTARERLAMLGTATAAVVHELKNPLAAIRSTTAILRRRLRDDERGRELAGVVEEEVGRLEGSLLEVLSFVRPGRLEPAPVVVEDLVRQLASVVEVDLRRSGVDLKITVEPGVSVVRVEEERLRRALLNLILNAREAMPRGGTVEVAVSPWRSDGGPPRGAQITVNDSGPGFSDEALARAFEPFFSSKRLGTGLGLANVRRTVEEAGGEVRLANRPSGGAAVTLSLPALPNGSGS